MHNWSLLLIVCLAVIQPIVSSTERGFFDGRQQCSDRQTRNDRNLLNDNRLSSRGNYRDNQRYNRYETRIDRNINDAHIEYRKQTLGRPDYIRDKAFNDNSRERSLTVNHRSESRENRRTERFARREEANRESRLRFIRDTQVTSNRNHVRFQPMQHRSSIARAIVFREQTGGDKAFQYTRRTDVRNQLRTFVTERRQNNEMDRNSQRMVRPADTSRSHIFFRERRSSDLLVARRGIREHNSLQRVQYLRNTARQEVESNNRLSLLENNIRLNREDPTRISRELDMLKRERNFSNDRDMIIRDERFRDRSNSFGLYRFNRFDNKREHRIGNIRVQSRMGNIQFEPTKLDDHETSTNLPWQCLLYTLQAVYIYSIISQLFYGKIKGKKNINFLASPTFMKQIKAE